MARRVTFVRKSDGKLFAHILFTGHWTDIQSEDGETDTVKWFGPYSFGYVSASKGHVYDKRVEE